jgi:hypothetical protein
MSAAVDGSFRATVILWMEVDFSTVTPLESMQKHLHLTLKSTEQSGHAICGIHSLFFVGSKTLVKAVVSHH